MFKADLLDRLDLRLGPQFIPPDGQDGNVLVKEGEEGAAGYTIRLEDQSRWLAEDFRRHLCRDCALAKAGLCSKMDTRTGIAETKTTPINLANIGKGCFKILLEKVGIGQRDPRKRGLLGF